MDKMQAIEILLSERFCASNTAGAREKLQAYDMALDSLKSIRPKGKWIRYGFGDYQCTNCKKHTALVMFYNYCPHCGAEMEVE